MSVFEPSKVGMTSPGKTEAKMTADAFLLWAEGLPKGQRHELLDGVVFAISTERLTLMPEP